MTTNVYFHLHECCQPVKGYLRSIICDFQRRDYKLIPNELYTILTSHRGKSVKEIKNIFNDKENDQIDLYFEYLIECQFGFFSNNSNESLPEMNFSFEEPCTISNAIIDIEEGSNHNYEDIIEQLSFLGCQALEVRIFSWPNINPLQRILIALQGSSIRSVNLVAPYCEAFKWEDYIAIMDNDSRLASVIIHSSEKTSIFEVNCDQRIEGISEKITLESHCGIVSPYYFNSDPKHFFESQVLNTCLNKKISIDKNGEIKNCPSFNKSFGSHKDHTLIEVLKNNEFSSIWKISKSQIKICQVCEFRHMCTDCRAYRVDIDLFSKPLKCDYDPYTASWAC